MMQMMLKTTLSIPLSSPHTVSLAFVWFAPGNQLMFAK